ncbi:hypothetical protein CTA1_11369 [Colletotrichum tanaceti]|uniref:Uncharacterized protein n=1 Tax=Colletotrichum tanaceti TaxID=1306861 RepID=A0A4U6XJ29_9PEZI|nr:hypothetical protein CTA1_11369 [Colletotrichum tanaceti]
MSGSSSTGASGAGASRPSIPRGTRDQPAKPVDRAVPVPDLADLTPEWTNDQSDMEIKMYFNPATTNLSMSYNIRGLQPVIRQVGGTRYLLKDEGDNFYRWDSDIPGLYRVMDATNMDEALDQIIFHPILMRVERVGHDGLGAGSSG